jgi:4-hydroxy-tetrahydrodipicolinate synthase
MFTGSIVALVTPMEANGAVDYDALDALVEFHIAEGTRAIVAVGTTGESATLNFDEHVEVIRRVIAKAARRVPVIAGTGANSTREAIELSEMARSVGADASLSVTPYYNKPTQEGLYQHFKAIAEAVPLPLILYNVPGRTGCDLKPETVLRLASIPGIVGLKEASGSLARNRELVGLVGQRLHLLSGDDDLACDTILAGFKGVISVVANVAPRRMSVMCDAALMGDVATAQRENAALMPLHRALFLESNPIPVKWALVHMGLIKAGMRLPLTPLSEAHHVAVTEALRAGGVALPASH